MTPEQMKALAEAATPGPWRWGGYDSAAIELQTVGRGRIRVLTTMKYVPCVVSNTGGDPILTDQHCSSCSDMWERWENTGEVEEDYRCPRPEALETLWVRDPASQTVVPINQYAVREQNYRADVARVDHPDADFIVAHDPTLLANLWDVVREAESGTDTTLTVALKAVYVHIGYEP